MRDLCPVFNNLTLSVLETHSVILRYCINTGWHGLGQFPLMGKCERNGVSERYTRALGAAEMLRALESSKF
jgi:hypothetical protein